MVTWMRTHWRKLSTGILLATLVGVGGAKAYAAMTGDCCGPSSPCCPGPCCHHGDHGTTAHR